MRKRSPGRRPAAVSVRRLRIMGAGMLLASGALGMRLFQLQLLSGQRYVTYGASQITQSVTLTPTRGSIVDRNGHVLAMSVTKSDVCVDPGLVRNAVAEAATLAPILQLPTSLIYQRLSGPGAFAYLRRQVGGGMAGEIRSHAAQLPGVYLVPAPARVAPNGSLALPLLGYTGIDGTGLAGLEYQYNGVLAGKPGLAVVESPTGTVALPGGLVKKKDPVQGATLKLSLSTAVQYETERVLSREIVTSKASGGMAVVEDVRTGQILAMASFVRKGRGAPQPAPSNYPVTFTYEPGSVMKIATFSGAITEGIITPSTQLPVPARLVIANSVFHDAEPHGNEILTATQILARSSNIGTIEIAQKLGAPAVSRWIARYGFGRVTPLAFPGESAGLIRPLAAWSATAIGSTPIGQDTGVTALQVLDAYNSVANGGVMIPPRLVLGVQRPNGTTWVPHEAKARRVVSSQVATTLTGMLEHVASVQGTAPAAAIPGYTVAGKTGTAQKPRLNGAGYQPGAFMATFVGFVPAQRPIFSAIVVLDRPTPIFGGSVAAPVFSQICGYALHLLASSPRSLTGSVSHASRA